jgi:hypothetical protein
MKQPVKRAWLNSAPLDALGDRHSRAAGERASSSRISEGKRWRCCDVGVPLTRLAGHPAETHGTPQGQTLEPSVILHTQCRHLRRFHNVNQRPRTTTCPVKVPRAEARLCPAYRRRLVNGRGWVMPGKATSVTSALFGSWPPPTTGREGIAVLGRIGRCGLVVQRLQRRRL